MYHLILHRILFYITQTLCEQTPSSATTLAVLNASGGINSTYSYEWYDIPNGNLVGSGSTFTDLHHHILHSSWMFNI